MRKITVTVDDSTYRAAHMRAAELDTSVSALVRDYLRGLVDERGMEMEQSEKVSKKTKAEYRKRMLEDAIKNIRVSSPEFRAADNLSRDTLYEQARTKPGSFYSGEIVKDDSQ